MSAGNRRKNPAASRWNRDLVAGLCFAIFGAVVWWWGRDLPRGTALRMGPGYIPAVLAGLIMVVGAALAVAGLRQPADEGEPWQPGAIIVVIGAIIAFVLTAEPLGLLPALFLAGLISQLPQLRQKPGPVLLIAAAISAALIAIFALGLGLPIKPLPWS